jgi:hypothetical protein
MATTTDIQKAISARFDYSGSTVPSTSDEWSRRLRIINQAEDTARRYLNGQWSFLLTPYTLTTIANQNYITLPSDYERGQGVVDQTGSLIINNTVFKLVEYPEVMSYDSTSNFIYITGNKSAGYKLYIQPTPADAYSIQFAYYTKQMAITSSNTGIDVLTNTDDVTKLPDPYYLSDWVIGELYRVNDEPENTWLPYKKEAEDRLIKMAVNDNREQNQSFTIPVLTEVQGYDVFESNGSD